jgi:hypothetical protein
MTIQEFNNKTASERLDLMNNHFSKWVIPYDSRQDNFDTNVERWEEVYGWKLPHTDKVIYNDFMRKQAGRLWNYTGD